MEFLRQLIRGIVQAWARLSLSARVNIVLAGAVSAIAIASLVFFGARPDYVLLYTRLSRQDAAAIVSYLDGQNITFKTQDNGQTVLVPRNRLSDIKMDLATEGLPTRQGVALGWEIFDTEQLMSNEFLQNVKYMRAVHGELERQLNELDFVNRSAVFIREAEESLFLDEQKPSKASVTLDLTRPLSPREVKGVLAIIGSFGGANLHPNNITLATSDGVFLHVPPTDEFASIANSKLDYVNEVERRLEGKVMEAFQQMGRKAVVRVSADIDFTSIKKTSEEWQEDEGAIISRLMDESTTTAKETMPEGPAGALANLPSEAVVAGGVLTDETSTRTLENFQPSKEVTETVIPPGQASGFKVAAIIEGDYETGEDGESKYVGLSGEKTTQFKEFIRYTVGVNVGADDIAISDHPFAVAGVVAPGVPAVGPRGFGMAGTWAIRIAQVVLIIGGFLLVRYFLRRAMVLPPEEEEEVVEIPEATAEDLRRQEVSTEVERLSQEAPDAVAALLRSWLSEEG